MNISDPASHLKEFINDIGSKLVELNDLADDALEIKRLRDSLVTLREELSAEKGKRVTLQKELQESRDHISELTKRVVDKLNRESVDSISEDLVTRCARSAFCSNYGLDPDDAELEWGRYLKKLSDSGKELSSSRFFVAAEASIREYEAIRMAFAS